MAKIIPPNRNDFITSKGDMTQRTAKFFESLSTDVNTVVEETITTEAEAAAGNLLAGVEGLAQDEAFQYFQPTINREWNASIATETYHSVSYDFIEAQTKYIYLPEFPNNSDPVIIASGFDQSVVILTKNYGVKVKNVESSVTISQKGNSLHFVFFAAGPYWRMT